MWRPLCFHFNFEMKTKLKDKIVCAYVCVSNTPAHTAQTVFKKEI